MKKMRTTTQDLFEAMAHSWQRRGMANELFGVCPECPEPKLPARKGPYPVLLVDEYAFAICDLHETSWNTGCSYMGPDYCLRDEKGNSVKDANGLGVHDPAYPHEEVKQNCRTLLRYRDVTETVIAEMLFCDPQEPVVKNINPSHFNLWLDRAPYQDMLFRFGFEARVKGIIDYLGGDFMCFADRDKDTGKLVKINHRQDENGEWVEEREVVQD